MLFVMYKKNILPAVMKDIYSNIIGDELLLNFGAKFQR